MDNANVILDNYGIDIPEIEQREPYIVYVKINKQNYIIAVNSSAFLTNISEWIEIDHGYTDKYHHAQGNYFEKSLYDERGICRYKLVNDMPVERTQEEMDADYIEPEQLPSQLDIIEAQVTYTAMMTDTLLEV